MIRLITPVVVGEAKAEYVEQAVKAAELARQLHNALNKLAQLQRHADGIEALRAEAWQERLDAVEAMESELLEHAMRVTLG